MGWRYLPYWLKGGLIGGIFGVLALVAPFLLWPFIQNKIVQLIIQGITYLSLPLSWITIYILSPIKEGTAGELGAAFFILFLTTPVNLFLWGALVGFIIGKIKSRNK